jgi:magnesium chelatase family protein
MQLTVPALPAEALLGEQAAENSAIVAARVAQARLRQQGRQSQANARLGVSEIGALCQPTAGADDLLLSAMARLGWSARAYHRVLKLARTIADLAGAPQVEPPHVAEAIQYRRALTLAA